MLIAAAAVSSGTVPLEPSLRALANSNLQPSVAGPLEFTQAERMLASV